MSTGNDSRSRARSLRELPQGIAPARDLWPQIAAQLEPRRRSWAVPASLAAGLLLATVAFVAGYRIHDTPAEPAVPADSGALIRTAMTPDEAYQREREALLATLPAKLAELPPESQQHVRDSLQAIQTAVKDIETELGSDAGNVLLQELFIRTQQEEMRVLTTIDQIDDLKQEI